ncbi:hypothetical protein [Nonomuraea sp. NPDC002799]
MSIADLARLRDEDLAAEPVGQASGAGARALMESIMMEERVPVRRGFPWRRGMGLGAVVAALSAALVLWSPFGGPVTEYANAAVTLRSGEDFLNVTINDPEADTATFTEAFRAVGLDAEVKKVPVAAEQVGELIGPATPGTFPAGTGVTVMHAEHCASVWCGTVSMPVRYTGRLIFGIGRLAEPGERYAQRVQIIPIPPQGVEDRSPDAYDGRGKPVSEVRAEMERRGMKIAYILMWLNPDGSGHGHQVDADRIEDDWVVESGQKVGPDAVELDVLAPADVPENSIPRADLPLPRGWWQD